MGGKLLRGSWNAQLYGPLHDFAAEGIANGTDVWHNKVRAVVVHVSSRLQRQQNRFSALSGPSSNLHAWLDDNEITTLVWAGVATDQCVWSSCIDGWTKVRSSSQPRAVSERSPGVRPDLGDGPLRLFQPGSVRPGSSSVVSRLTRETAHETRPCGTPLRRDGARPRMT
jgi:hypothetical protein